MARITSTECLLLLVLLGAGCVDSSSSSNAALTCSTVYGALSPCIGYLIGGSTLTPPPECCTGLGSLLSMDTADRKTACGCLKSLANEAWPDILKRAAGLPGVCLVSLPYKLSPSTDCNRIK